MTKTNAFGLSVRLTKNAGLPKFWFATLFATITYLAISTRAVLSPYEINHFVDAKRIFSVLLGTGVLWLTLRAADKHWGHKAAIQALAVLRVAAAGMVVLLAAREFYDLAISGDLMANFAINIRFMLNWIGYFAAAVAGFMALGYHWQLQTIRRSLNGYGASIGGSRDPIATADYEVADIGFDPRQAA